MKLDRTNGNFFHLRTNYRHFCCLVAVRGLKVPQVEADESAVGEQGMAVFMPYRMLPSRRELLSWSILVKLLLVDFG